MPIHNLFPTPIGRYVLPRMLETSEVSFIQDQDTRGNIGNSTSKDNNVLNRTELKDVKSFIETSLYDYFTSVYNPKHKVNLRITQSWINYTKPGQYHHKHKHPNSFVSGVFYPKANKETDRIYFYKNGSDLIKLPPKEWNTWNSESWWFDVGTGDLIIFPSSLEHMVETVQGNDTRISLSFNTFLVGNIGEELELTGLQIGELDGAFR
jgi:uncharacterized protein (TIGR02466 family)